MIILVLIFGISLFGKLAYPLMWNDEAETVMQATRVMTWGYPKVHDGKNVLNLTEVADKSVGVKESIDAWIHLGWGQYYFAVIGVYIASFFEDLYVKTFWLRFPFAVVGFLGVMFYWFVIDSISFLKRHRIEAMIGFVTLEIFSIFLVLHLREARNYSPNLFLTMVFIYLFVRYRFQKERWGRYCIGLPVLVFVAYNFYFPLTVVYLIFLALIEVLELLKNSNGKNGLKWLWPILFSIIVVTPLVFFYETLYVSRALSEGFNNGFLLYAQNLLSAVVFLTKYDLFYLLMFSRTVVLIALRKYGEEQKVANYLSLFVLVYLLVVSRMPYLFERYLVPLQPVVALLIIIDFALIYDFRKKVAGIWEVSISFGLTSYLLFLGMFGFGNIFGHIYELTHRYQGPLDYVIPYLKSRYQNTEDLIIATNYEEGVYMYYLGSRVIIGYVGNNLEEDLKLEPDVVIPRLGRPNSREVLDKFIATGDYEHITFPVYDYQYNNISELGLVYPHLYETKYAESKDEALTIYVRKN